MTMILRAALLTAAAIVSLTVPAAAAATPSALSLPNLNGWKRWLTVAVTGADHYSFTDLDYLVNQSGALPIPTAPRSMTITTTYVSAFFQRHLNGRPEPLFNGPSTAFSEVIFTNP